MAKRRQVQNPEKLAVLNERRARRAEEGAVAMAVEAIETYIEALARLAQIRLNLGIGPIPFWIGRSYARTIEH